MNTTCGASNISFGLPNRHAINAAFLPMAMTAGMTSAIMNPTRLEEMNAIRAANLLLNNDAHGARWIKSNRPTVDKDHEPTIGRRRSRRNR